MNNEAIARTRCVTALMLFAPLINPDYYTNKHEKELAATCNRWSKLCFDSVAPTVKKPLSAPANRTLKNVMTAFGRFMGIFEADAAEKISSETTAAGIVAVSHLLFDAVSLGGGMTSRTCWHKMDESTVKLCKQIIADYPDSEEAGYKLYEDLCEVMG